MLTLKEWMEIVDYRITEGSDYHWHCYGDNAYCLDSWNGEQDGHSFTVIFDTQTQEVCEVQAHDYVNNRAYRMINPNFAPKHMMESADRNVRDQEAWDDVNYVDLESDDDFIQKCLAIKEGKTYDTRVQVPIDLSDDELFQVMKMAHERDITLNQMVEEILWAAISKEKVEAQ